MNEEYVYVIKNEWTPLGDEATQEEIVNGRYFKTHEDAWERLSQIAEAHGIVLDPDQEGFSGPLGGSENGQEYYIDELWSY